MGDVLLFTRHGFEDYIVHVGSSEKAERTWHILHTDHGLVYRRLCYRTPCRNGVGSINTINEECHEFGSGTIGRVLMGDLNVHEAAWLRHSKGSSLEGTVLHEHCVENWLTERVRAPTRGLHLLDLVSSDVQTSITACVAAGIADHQGVLGSLSFPLQHVHHIKREVFDYERATWSELCASLRQEDCANVFDKNDVDSTVARLNDVLMHAVRAHIPSRLKGEEKRHHEWPGDNCRRAVREKREAFGTQVFLSKRDACSQVPSEAFSAYVGRTHDKMPKLKRSSKQLLKLARSLMSLGTSGEAIPPLKRSDASWAKSSSDTANLFAKVIDKKSQLDDAVVNSSTEVAGADEALMNSPFLQVRRRYVSRVLKAIDERTATGPDKLAARVLRRCRAELELPILNYDA